MVVCFFVVAFVCLFVCLFIIHWQLVLAGGVDAVVAAAVVCLLAYRLFPDGLSVSFLLLVACLLLCVCHISGFFVCFVCLKGVFVACLMTLWNS